MCPLAPVEPNPIPTTAQYDLLSTTMLHPSVDGLQIGGKADAPLGSSVRCGGRKNCSHWALAGEKPNWAPGEKSD